MTPSLNRRDFLAHSAAAGVALAASGTVLGANKAAARSVTDKVTLGQTGISLSLVGMGTGSVGSDQASNQTRLGVKDFTKVVRHALDRGVCFFDVADQYGSHTYLREALKGVDRDKYVIQTKTHSTNLANCKSHLERYRMELGVDRIDIVLLHCMTEANWPEKHTGAMEYLDRAKSEGIIRAHGTSCHGMPPLRTAAKTPFVEVDLARINPEGKYMDDARPDEVVSVLEEMHQAGKGVIGMKIVGQGEINTPDRIDASLRYVLGLGSVTNFIVGFETTNQIDDLLDRTQKVLDTLAAKV